jgi:hypothetical protein
MVIKSKRRAGQVTRMSEMRNVWKISVANLKR